MTQLSLFLQTDYILPMQFVASLIAFLWLTTVYYRSYGLAISYCEVCSVYHGLQDVIFVHSLVAYDNH